MRLAEELLLLLRDEDGALSRAPEWSARHALAGAVLMDLALEHRIDTDAQRLFMVDTTSVGDQLLDPVLAEIARADRTHDALHWVKRATRHADEIRDTALARLIDSHILELSEDRFHAGPNCAYASRGWSRSKPCGPLRLVSKSAWNTTSGGGHPHFRSAS